MQQAYSFPFACCLARRWSLFRLCVATLLHSRFDTQQHYLPSTYLIQSQPRFTFTVTPSQRNGTLSQTSTSRQRLDVCRLITFKYVSYIQTRINTHIMSRSFTSNLFVFYHLIMHVKARLQRHNSTQLDVELSCVAINTPLMFCSFCARCVLSSF